MNKRASPLLLQLMGSAVLMQALLSAASLIVGLVLLRRTADLQYGYYVLMQSSILLLTMLQSAFIGAQLVTHISTADPDRRAAVVGDCTGNSGACGSSQAC